MLRISVFESKELQAVIVALRKDLPLGTKLQIQLHTKNLGLPEWQAEMAKNYSTPFENKVLVQAANITTGPNNVQLQAGASAATLSGGGVISDLARGAEFGSTHFPQFRARTRKGYVAYPAARTFIPRIASLWVQTVVRTLHETVEGATT